MEEILTLAIGAKVMLRRNLNPEIGLLNGSVGTVIGFVEGRFDKYGRVLVNFEINGGTLVEIRRCSSEFETSEGSFKIRYQFPLQLANAVTIHRAQGLTMNQVLLDLSDSGFQLPAMTYVGLSRVKSLEGLHLIDFGYSVVSADKRAIDFYNGQRFQNGLPKIERFNHRPALYQKRTILQNKVNNTVDAILRKYVLSICRAKFLEDRKTERGR